MEEGELEETFEFLAEEGLEKGEDEEGKGGDPVATANVDDDDRQPIPEGKVIGRPYYDSTIPAIPAMIALATSLAPTQFSPWSHCQISTVLVYLDCFRASIDHRTLLIFGQL